MIQQQASLRSRLSSAVYLVPNLCCSWRACACWQATYRRQRLGSRTMEMMLRLLRTKTDCDYATLHVKSTNVAAVGFYERMGFTCDPHVGYLKNHYFINGKHWDAYRYSRSLRHPLLMFVRDMCSIL